MDFVAIVSAEIGDEMRRREAAPDVRVVPIIAIAQHERVRPGAAARDRAVVLRLAEVDVVVAVPALQGREHRGRADGIIPRPAAHRVGVAPATVQHILAVTTVDRIVTLAARQLVIAAQTVDDVVAVAAVDAVGEGGAGQRVVAVLAIDRAFARRGNDVVALATVQIVVAVTARDGVVARLAEDVVAARSTIDRIVALAAQQLVVVVVAVQRVVAGLAAQHVIVVAAAQHVGAVAAPQYVLAHPGGHIVVARAAINQVVAGIVGNLVVAGQTIDLVADLPTVQRIGRRRAGDRHKRTLDEIGAGDPARQRPGREFHHQIRGGQRQVAIKIDHQRRPGGRPRADAGPPHLDELVAEVRAGQRRAIGVERCIQLPAEDQRVTISRPARGKADADLVRVGPAEIGDQVRGRKAAPDVGVVPIVAIAELEHIGTRTAGGRAAVVL